MRPENSRRLKDMRIGISVSESEETETYGFDSHEVNRAVREISLAVLSQGGRLVFGHDWRSEGVMASVFSFALDYQMPSLDDEEGGAMIRNLVPWPKKSGVSPDERRRLGDIIEVQELRPPSILPTMRRTLERRVASLTYMREQLASAADARIAIGGRTSGSGGRASGVVEEVYLTLQANKPVYLSGLFGGAAQQIIDVILGHHDGDLSAFRPRNDVVKVLEVSALFNGYGIDPMGLGAFPITQISKVNGLNPDENLALFQATDLGQVIGNVLTGLGRLNNKKRQESGLEMGQ